MFGVLARDAEYVDMNRLKTLVAALACSVPGSGQGFVQGDLYLYTPLATGLSSGNGGVVRIDPATGATSLVAGPFGANIRRDQIAYDSFRDALLFSVTTSNHPVAPALYAMDAAGVMVNLGFGDRAFYCLAPTGDGRVYVRQNPANPGGAVLYLDAGNQLRALFDASGVQPFEFVPGSNLDFEQLTYHAPSNALIAFARSGSPLCGGGTSTSVVAYRAPLSADGARVVGPVTCETFEVSPSAERPVGLSPLPGGDLLLVVDTSSNQLEPRMVRVDPFSLAMTPFASNQHVFAAATNAGCFSTRIGKAVVLDTGGDQLRAFAFGETGGGTIITPVGGQHVSPPGGSGEAATMIEIDRAPCAGSLRLYGDALVGTGGFAPSLSATGCPVANATVTLHVASGLGATNGALLVGTIETSFSILGGTLLVAPLFSVPIALGGAPGAAGDGRLEIPLSVGTPSVPSFVFQSMLLDPVGPSGLSMTNGLEVVFG